MRTNSPAVSVIIPVYNAEKYLRQCLDSVINQTLEEIEIICVDDGSLDGSLDILHEYAERDDRIKVITQQNQYAGVARNNGMKAAKGKYYVFLDADDFFDENLLKYQYDACEKREADISICGVDKYDIGTDSFISADWMLKKHFLKGKKIFNAETLGDRLYQFTTPAPWNKMFKAAFIRELGLEFQNVSRANDVFFVWSALACAKRITYVDTVLVHYRVGMTTNLQSNNKQSPLNFYQALTAVRELLLEKNLYAALEQSYINDFVGQCEYTLRTLKDPEHESYKELVAKIREDAIPNLGLLSHPEEYYYQKERYQRLKNQLETADMPRVSVIIPVYNVEDYLSECLESVVHQTLNHIEIICVDDGSTDGSSSILSEYAESDHRITVIKQPNSGLSVARNTGIKEAHGEYILFLDSDDYIEESAAEYLYYQAKENELDVLCFDGEAFYEEGRKPDNQGGCHRSREYGKIYNGIELYTLMRRNNDYKPMVWLQLISRKHMIDKGLSFHEHIIHEDVPFSFACMLLAERVSHRKKEFYHYRRRSSSITGQNMTVGHICGRVAGMVDMLSLMSMIDIGSDAQSYTIKYLDWMRGEVLRGIESNELDKRILWEKLTPAEAYFLSQLQKKKIQEIWAGRWNSKETKSAVHSTRDMRKEMEDLLNSRSYRIGRMITWLPRKIRGGIRCWQEHGFVHTLKRTLVHLHLRTEPVSGRNQKQSGQKSVSDNAVQKQKEIKRLPLGCSEEKHSPELIVSLTSYPARIGTVHMTIDTILRQTERPDRVLLWLAEEQFPNKEKDLPAELLKLTESGLTICWCDDLKSHKKYYYTMREYPEALVITVDDDVLYPSDLIELLVQAHLQHPKSVCAIRGRVIGTEKKEDGTIEIEPYNDWKLLECGEGFGPSLSVVPTGVGGVLYPPHCLHESVYDKEAIQNLCLNADDLWLKLKELQQGTPVYKIGWKYPRIIYVEGTQENSLYHMNMGENQNDQCIKRLEEYYSENTEETERIMNMIYDCSSHEKDGR